MNTKKFTATLLSLDKTRKILFAPWGNSVHIVMKLE